MVDSILATRYGMKQQGEFCVDMTILPSMLQRFNSNMYDHHKKAGATMQLRPQNQRDGEEEEENEEMIQILQEVEDILGSPVFIVPQYGLNNVTL